MLRQVTRHRGTAGMCWGGGPMLELLGALGLELVALQRGWEVGTSMWAHPHPALGFCQG